MATDETAVADRAGDGTAVDHHRNDRVDPRDMDLSGEEHVPKARKPYTITKQREKWTEDEHRRFLEALQLHGRAWRRIQEHIGTKTAVQIRSHAQKFFTKVVRESSSGSNASGGGAAPAIQIPPPRPKRKPAHPYPRKVDGGAAKKPAPELKQLEKPPLAPMPDQDEEGSPTSVLTSAQMVLRGAEVFANSSSTSRSPALSAAGSDERDNEGGSLASSLDGEDACASPARTRAPYTTKVLGDASQVGSEAPILKLFGKKVVVEDLKTDSSSPASAVQATRNGNPIGAAGAASPWNPWPGSVQVQQLMYLVPQPDGFAAAQPAVVPWFGYNGSLPCAVFYPQPQAVVAAAPEHQQQQQQQVSEPLDHRRAQREGSLTGSNTAASSAAAVPAASVAQNSDTAESHHGGAGQENTSDGYAALPLRRSAAVPRLTKCTSSVSFSGRGFVPYKRCAAESQAPRPVVAPGEEADGELTRLCL